MTQHYDLLVIGGGAAGSTVASAANDDGRHVLQIERDKMGGTCLNYGCDPTKTLLHLAAQLHEAQQARPTGIDFGTPRVDWQQVQHYLREVTDRLRGGNDAKARQQVKETGVDLVKGEARFVGPHEVAVGDTTYRAEKILIATGSSAVVPDLPGLRDAGFLTNREAIWLDELPHRMTIIGGGPIGIEFAQMFHRFGVKVNVLEQGKQILPKDDSEVVTMLHDLLVDAGISIETNCTLVKVERHGAARQIHYTTADGNDATITTDVILVATGFDPEIKGMNLEAAGVEVKDGAVVVDKELRTTTPHIWAAGDVLGKYQFTHVASTQGSLLAHSMWSKKPAAFDDRVIPWVTYTSPESAHVGKTEEELREAGEHYFVGKQEMQEIERAVAMHQTSGVVKLLIGRDGAILGGHILAASAGEMIAPVALAMHAQRSIHELADTILPYPTLTEAVRRAASAAIEAQKAS